MTQAPCMAVCRTVTRGLNLSNLFWKFCDQLLHSKETRGRKLPHLKIGKRYQSQRTLKILIPRTQDPSWTSSNQKVKQSKLFSCVAVPTKNHNGNQVLLHFATRFEPIIHCRTNTIKTSKSNRLAVESSGSLMAF